MMPANSLLNFIAGFFIITVQGCAVIRQRGRSGFVQSNLGPVFL